MDIFEVYFFLLADSFMTSLILPMQSHLVFPVMLIMGGYNIYFTVLVASFGALIAFVANWYLGYFILLTSKYNPKGGKAIGFVGFCRDHSAWLLVLSWVPILGSVISVVMGVVKVNFTRAITVFTLVNLIYFIILTQIP